MRAVQIANHVVHCQRRVLFFSRERDDIISVRKPPVAGSLPYLQTAYIYMQHLLYLWSGTVFSLVLPLASHLDSARFPLTTAFTIVTITGVGLCDEVALQLCFGDAKIRRICAVGGQLVAQVCEEIHGRRT